MQAEENNNVVRRNSGHHAANDLQLSVLTLQKINNSLGVTITSFVVSFYL